MVGTVAPGRARPLGGDVLTLLLDTRHRADPYPVYKRLREAEIAFTTGNGRPHRPPATASSSAFSGICEPMVAAV